MTKTIISIKCKMGVLDFFVPNHVYLFKRVGDTNVFKHIIEEGRHPIEVVIPRNEIGYINPYSRIPNHMMYFKDDKQIYFNFNNEKQYIEKDMIGNDLLYRSSGFPDKYNLTRTHNEFQRRIPKQIYIRREDKETLQAYFQNPSEDSILHEGFEFRVPTVQAPKAIKIKNVTVSSAPLATAENMQLKLNQLSLFEKFVLSLFQPQNSSGVPAILKMLRQKHEFMEDDIDNDSFLGGPDLEEEKKILKLAGKIVIFELYNDKNVNEIIYNKFYFQIRNDMVNYMNEIQIILDTRHETIEDIFNAYDMLIEIFVRIEKLINRNGSTGGAFTYKSTGESVRIGKLTRVLHRKNGKGRAVYIKWKGDYKTLDEVRKII